MPGMREGLDLRHIPCLAALSDAIYVPMWRTSRQCSVRSITKIIFEID